MHKFLNRFVIHLTQDFQPPQSLQGVSHGDIKAAHGADVKPFLQNVKNILIQ